MRDRGGSTGRGRQRDLARGHRPDDEERAQLAARASQASHPDHLDAPSMLSLQASAGNGAAARVVQRFDDDQGSDQEGAEESEGTTSGGVAYTAGAPAGSGFAAMWTAVLSGAQVYQTSGALPPFASAASAYPVYSTVPFVAHARPHSMPIVRSAGPVMPSGGPMPAGVSNDAGSAGAAAGGQAGQQAAHGGGAGAGAAGAAGQVSGGGGGGGGGGLPALPGTRQISAGFQGQDVIALQMALNDKLGASLGTDGAFGGMTDRAVRAFQTEQRLGADGVVGPRTWNALGFEPSF